MEFQDASRVRVLGKSKVPYAAQTVNHVVGCTHDCGYCYAPNVHMRGGRLRSRDDWPQVAIVRSAPEMLRRELSRKRTLPEWIHMSFSGDPFMYDAATGEAVPEIADVTIRLIEVANEFEVPVSVLTKGVYPGVLLERVDELHPDNQYGITITSFNADFTDIWEPGAAEPESRVSSLRALAEAGARTWVSIEPYPTPNLDCDAADFTLVSGRLDMVEKVIFGKMNYVTESTQWANTHTHFYENIAAEVAEWCESFGMPYCIKDGTPGTRRGREDVLSPSVRRVRPRLTLVEGSIVDMRPRQERRG